MIILNTILKKKNSVHIFFTPSNYVPTKNPWFEENNPIKLRTFQKGKLTKSDQNVHLITKSDQF